MTERGYRGVFILTSALAAYLVFLKVDFIQRGGPVMFPIVLSSILAFSIVAAKIRQFFRESVSVEDLLKNIFERMERQRIKEAMDLCDQARAPLARVLKAGIMKYDRPKDDIKEAMEDVFLYEVPLLEEGLSILSTIVQITPLLGLLGTMAGMMRIFLILQSRGASFMPTALGDLAPGIWQALISTVAGFLVAIPALVAYNYLADRVKSRADEIERGAAELLSFLMERRLSV